MWLKAHFKRPFQSNKYKIEQNRIDASFIVPQTWKIRCNTSNKYKGANKKSS